MLACPGRSRFVSPAAFPRDGMGCCHRAGRPGGPAGRGWRWPRVPRVPPHRGRLQGGERPGCKNNPSLLCSELKNKGAGVWEQARVLGAHPGLSGMGWPWPGKGTLGGLDGEVAGSPEPSRSHDVWGSRAEVLPAGVGQEEKGN